MTKKRNITCKPLIPHLWDDLEKLFGKSGAYWGCWCMYWRCSNKEFESLKAEQRKKNLHKVVMESDHAPGILAYIDNNPVGWLALSPKDEYTRLVKSRVIKPLDDKPVWSLVCFFIQKEYRGMGITEALIEYAIEYAKLNGASIVESYPIESTERINADSAYVGVDKWFSKVGFIKGADTKAKGGGKKKIIMRKNLI